MPHRPSPGTHQVPGAESTQLSAGSSMWSPETPLGDGKNSADSSLDPGAVGSQLQPHGGISVVTRGLGESL